MKPMLAAAITADDLDKLEYPVWVQVKYDGIRAYKWEGQVYTRTGKSIPNTQLRHYLETYVEDGCDFEILSPRGFSHCQSVVMSHEHTDTVLIQVVVFDVISPQPFGQRVASLLRNPFGAITHKVYTPDEVLHQYQDYVDWRYEGIIIRGDRPYKHGRSTLKGQQLLKMKPRDDMEATILDVFPLVRKDGTVEPVLGALLCVRNGIEFCIGTGFTYNQREELWQQDLVGKQVSFFGEPTTKEAPRFPVFHRIREDE